MPRVKRNIIIAFLAGIFFAANVSAQENNDATTATEVVPYYPYIIEGGGELIYPLGNYALDSNFGGVFFAHLSVQTKVYKRLNAGLEFQINQISEVSSQPFPIATATPHIYFYNPGLKISYNSSEINLWYFSGSLVAGPSILYFTNIPGLNHGVESKSYFVSTRISEALKVNDELRVGLEISLLLEGYAFHPIDVNLGVNDPPSETSASSLFFGWGFNVTYFLGKAKHE